MYVTLVTLKQLSKHIYESCYRIFSLAAFLGPSDYVLLPNGIPMRSPKQAVVKAA